METRAIAPQSEAASMLAVPAVSATAKAGTRLLFVDNLRVFLTILVLLHHLMIIYSGSGDWIFQEGRQDIITTALGAWFTSVNQAYFMSFFLLISAYFIPGAYERKGARQFLKDRLVRLGIPLVVYSWIIQPVWVYTYRRIAQETQLSFGQFMTRQYIPYGELIGGGPTWFVSLLLLLSIVYVLGRQILDRREGQTIRRLSPSPVAQASFPRDRSIVAFAAGMSLVTFVVHLLWPMGWNFVPLNFQLPYFSLYIALFFAGILAYRRDWFRSLPDSTGRRWLTVAIVLIVAYPVIAIAGGGLEDSTPYLGGWTYQSLFYTTWEAFLCVSMVIGLSYLFRRYANRQAESPRAARVLSWLTRNAYGAYLVQAPVLTLSAMLLYYGPVYPLLKWALVALYSVPLCFAVAALLRKIPYADRVL